MKTSSSPRHLVPDHPAYIPQELWQEVEHHAATTNRTATDVVLTAVREYLKAEHLCASP